MKKDKPTVYTSDRVFNGVRIKTGEDALKHIERVKRALNKRKHSGVVQLVVTQDSES